MRKINPWFLTGEDFPQHFIDDFVEKAVIPPVFVSDFDLKHFSRQVLGSMSLSLEEKTKVLDSLPTLSSFQCCELQKNFNEEIREFYKLPDEHPIILRLSAAAAFGACALALHRGAGIASAEEETAMIRAMGSSKRKSNRRLQNFLKDMPCRQPLVDYVYSETLVSHPDIPDWLRKGI